MTTVKHKTTGEIIAQTSDDIELIIIPDQLGLWDSANGDKAFLSIHEPAELVYTPAVGNVHYQVAFKNFVQSENDPTTSELFAGQSIDWLNTTTGILKRFANVGGVLKSITYS